MKISIIIIEYFCIEEVMQCVESVEKHLNSTEYELIVLSNSCYTDSQLTGFRERLQSWVKILSTGANLGYAGGVNAALDSATGDYIYILNPDCILQDGKAAEIVTHMESDPEWVVAGPKVIDADSNIQPSCRRFPRPWTFMFVRTFLSKTGLGNAEKKFYFMEDFNHDETHDVDWVSGGALIAKTGVINQLGGMDTRYFLYMEDVDLCRTVRKNGFKIKYCPISTVVHAGQHASTKGGVKVIFSKSFRLHIISLIKYFAKWGLA